MKAVIVLALAFALALVLPSLPSASAASVDAATWGAPGAPVQASPGDTARPLSVSIRNDDTSVYTNVRATLGAVDGLAPAPGGGSAALSGTWNAGDVFVAKFFVDVAPNASVSTVYEIPLTLHETIPKTTVSQEVDLLVPVQLTGHPVLSLAASPSTLPSNDTTDVRITLKNAGDGPAGGVTLSVAPATGSGLALVRTESARSLGGMLPGDAKVATFTVRAPLGGSAALAAQLSYTDAAGTPASETRTLYFDLSTTPSATAPLRQNVTVALAEDHLDSGRPGSLHFTVTNGLGETMTGATFSLDTSTSTTVQPVGATSTQALGDIAPGGSAPVKVDFITTNGATGILKLTAHARWQDANGSTVDQAYDFGLALLGTVDVSLTGASASIGSSGSAIVTGTLTNLGNALAHNAYVQIAGGGGGYAPTEPTYLGDINPNTALPFTLTTTATNATIPNGTGGFGGRGDRTGGGGFGNATGFGNGTRGAGGGFGRFAGGRDQVVFLVQWNDDYGTLHTAILNATVRVRSATSTVSPSSTGGTKSIPAFGLVALAGAACVAAALARRRR